MRKIFTLLLSLVLLPLVAWGQSDETNAWDGSSVNTDWYDNHTGDGPFQISTAADLAGFVNVVQNNSSDLFKGKIVELIADINLNNKEWTPIGLASTTITYPDKGKFNGTFDGKGHIISGLNLVNVTTEKGGSALFAHLGSNGVIKNLAVKGNSLPTTKVYVGIICGDNEGLIENCYSIGKATGVISTGGLCGNNKGIIKNCYSNVTVIGNSNQAAGGLCGNNINGTIENCFSVGSVSGVESKYSIYGGLIGGNGKGKISDSGYLVGMEGENCEKYLEYGVSARTIIKTLEDFFATDGTDTYWKSTFSYTDGVFTLPTFKDEEIISVTDPGFMTEADIYEIKNVANLRWFADEVNSGNTSINAKLMNDIIVSEFAIKYDTGEPYSTDKPDVSNWIPIGNETNPYIGEFNGNGFGVKGIYMNEENDENLGLFGCVGETGKIQALYLNECYFAGKNNVGTVCGWNKGTIQDVYTATYRTSAVILSGAETTLNVGGICGYNEGTINCSFNTGHVKGIDGSTINAGGICGYNSTNGTVKNCYNFKESKSLVGNICGNNEGMVESSGFLVGLSEKSGIGKGVDSDKDLRMPVQKIVADMNNTYSEKVWTRRASGTSNFMHPRFAAASPLASIDSSDEYFAVTIGEYNKDAGTVTIEGNNELCGYYKCGSGTQVWIKVTTNLGYEIASVTINGSVWDIEDYFYYDSATTAEVVVKFQKTANSIYIDQIEGGEITYTVNGAQSTTAVMGDEIELAIIPEVGYQLQENSLKVTAENGEKIEVIDNKFIMPSGNVTITANFEKEPDPEPEEPETPDTPVTPDYPDYYNIYVEECEGVTVETSTNVVREGNSMSFTIEVAEGYTAEDMVVKVKRSLFGYTDIIEPNEEGKYEIRNIYTEIYITVEGVEKEIPTGIEEITGVKVYTKDGSLYVQTPKQEQVAIISISGAVIKNETQIGLKRYDLPRGIYIVRVGEETYKVRN